MHYIEVLVGKLFNKMGSYQVSDPDCVISNFKSISDSNEDSNEEESKVSESCGVLSWRTRIFFSVGHIFNDLCAAVWFSYTLLFFQLQFSGNTAGILLLYAHVV